MTTTSLLPYIALVTAGQEFVYGETMAQPLPPGLTITVITEDDDIPTTFFEGLKDCEVGRVVELDQALNDQPPAPQP